MNLSVLVDGTVDSDWVNGRGLTLAPGVVLVTLDTKMKRPEIQGRNDGDGDVPILRFEAGSESYLNGERLYSGAYETEVSFVDFPGWNIVIASVEGRYTIRVLLTQEAL